MIPFFEFLFYLIANAKAERCIENPYCCYNKGGMKLQKIEYVLLVANKKERLETTD